MQIVDVQTVQYIRNTKVHPSGRHLIPVKGAEKEGVTKDCTIRALANASGIDYDTIAEWAKTNVGYVVNRGLYNEQILKLYRHFGFDIKGVFGTTQCAKAWPYVPGINPSTLKRYKGRTVENLMYSMPANKTYIVEIRGHVFAVVNGEIVDRGYVGKNQRVISIYSKA